jgi:hypothetical protein
MGDIRARTPERSEGTGSSDTASLFVRALSARDASGWLKGALGKDVVGGEERMEQFVLSYSEAARRLGKRPVAWTPDEIAGLRAAGVVWSLDPWGVDELGRVTLLCLAFARESAGALARLEECYARGDNRERQAVLRALPFVALAATEVLACFVALARDACRTSVQTIFEAIACENPFPADHFPDAAFQQMALKAVFIGVPVARIVGLERRRTPELARMAEDYVAERRAAGRSVPSDIAMLTTREAP